VTQPAKDLDKLAAEHSADSQTARKSRCLRRMRTKPTSTPVKQVAPTTDLLYKYNPTLHLSSSGGQGCSSTTAGPTPSGGTVAPPSPTRRVVRERPLQIIREPAQRLQPRVGPAANLDAGSLPDVAKRTYSRSLSGDRHRFGAPDLIFGPTQGIRAIPGTPTSSPPRRSTWPASVRVMDPRRSGRLPYPGAPPYWSADLLLARTATPL